MKLKNLSKWLKFGLLFIGIYLFLFIISILFFGWGGGILIITISPTTWIQQADNVAINYLGDWDSFSAVFFKCYRLVFNWCFNWFNNPKDILFKFIF